MRRPARDRARCRVRCTAILAATRGAQPLRDGAEAFAAALDIGAQQLRAQPAADPRIAHAMNVRIGAQRPAQARRGVIEPLPRQRQNFVGAPAARGPPTQFGAARILIAPPTGQARGAPANRYRRRRSARTGTAISAAAVGVGARRSAAKSISVTSVSWPTAEISGMKLAAAARTTISSLNDHRSSSEPPPRATMMRSGRGGSAADSRQRVEAVDRGGDFRGGAFALHLDRPDQHVARETVGEPMQDVADHGAGRRGDDADDRRQERQQLLARLVEQTLGGEFLLALLQAAPSARRSRPAPASRR